MHRSKGRIIQRDTLEADLDGLLHEFVDQNKVSLKCNLHTCQVWSLRDAGVTPRLPDLVSAPKSENGVFLF